MSVRAHNLTSLRFYFSYWSSTISSSSVHLIYLFIKMCVCWLGCQICKCNFYVKLYWPHAARCRRNRSAVILFFRSFINFLSRLFSMRDLWRKEEIISVNSTLILRFTVEQIFAIQYCFLYSIKSLGGGMKYSSVCEIFRYKMKLSYNCDMFFTMFWI